MKHTSNYLPELTMEQKINSVVHGWLRDRERALRMHRQRLAAIRLAEYRRRTMKAADALVRSGDDFVGVSQHLDSLSEFVAWYHGYYGEPVPANPKPCTPGRPTEWPNTEFKKIVLQLVAEGSSMRGAACRVAAHVVDRWAPHLSEDDREALLGPWVEATDQRSRLADRLRVKGNKH